MNTAYRNSHRFAAVRLASVALSALLTLSTLWSVDRLAAVDAADGAATKMVQRAAPKG